MLNNHKKIRILVVSAFIMLILLALGIEIRYRGSKVKEILRFNRRILSNKF